MQDDSEYFSKRFESSFIENETRSEGSEIQTIQESKLQVNIEFLEDVANSKNRVRKGSSYHEDFIL